MPEQTKVSLYGITEKIELLEQLLANDFGEVSEVTETLTMEITEMLTTKTDSIVGYMNRESDTLNLIVTNIKELQDFGI